MRIKSKLKATVMAVTLATLPLVAQSAGLGRLNVLSGLGQPLRAEIDLVAVQAAEIETLRAALAAPDSYREAQIDYPPTSLGLRFNVDKRPNGQYFIVVNSNQSVNEPFLDFLVELKWEGGRVLREYTALLDPVGYSPSANTSAPVATKSNAPSASTSSSATIAQSAAVIAPPAKPAVIAKSEPVKKSDLKAPPASPDVKEKVEAAVTYTTKPGDTLVGVARMNMVEGVSLEQMLVGLYRANEEAFEGNNMNRLKKGRVLNIPSKESLASLNGNSVNQEIKAQAEDWRAYRTKVADSAGSSHVDKAAGSEKITAKVEDKAKAASPVSKDTLKLSKGEDGKLKERVQSLEEEATARQKALTEASQRVADLEKTNKKLEDLLALKSKQGLELQKQASAKVEAKTAEPKSPELKTVPKPIEAPKAETKLADAKSVEAKHVETKPGMPEQHLADPEKKPAEANPVAEGEVKLQPPKPKKKPIIVAPQPEPEQSLFDNPMMVGGGILALAGLGIGGLLFARRRKKGSFEDSVITGSDLKSNTMVGNTGGAVISTGVTENSFLTDFSRAGLGTIDTDEVDPIAEAEVYMAYGRDAQAEEILKDALTRDGSRQEVRLKLLEIYSGRKNVSAFEGVAQELYSATQGAGALWSQAADMGRALDPQNSLYQQQAPVDTGALDQTMVMSAGTLGETGRFETPLADFSATDADLDFQLDATVAEPVEPDQADEAIDFDLGFDGEPLDNTDLLVAAIERSEDSDQEALPIADSVTPAEDDATLDFDMGDFDLDLPAAVAEASEAQTPMLTDDAILSLDIPLDMPVESDVVPTNHAADVDQAELSMPDLNMPDLGSEPVELDAVGLGDGLDFDFDLGESSLDADLTEPVLNLDGISLDLDTAPEAAGGGDVMDFGAELDDPVTTKIDLARAYIDMGDQEGAREILQEAVNEGSEEQKQTAEALLTQL